jgi:hypothetical protein
MRRWRRCARRALGRGRAARSLRHGTRADPVRGFATGAKPATGGESVDSPSSASADAGRRAPGREGACRAAWPAVTRTPRSLRHGTRVDVVEELAVGVKPTTEGESAATRHDGHSYTRTGPSTGLLTGNAPLPMCPDKTVTHVPGLDPPPVRNPACAPPPPLIYAPRGHATGAQYPRGRPSTSGNRLPTHHARTPLRPDSAALPRPHGLASARTYRSATYPVPQSRRHAHCRHQ